MADQEFLASFGVDIMMKSERGAGFVMKRKGEKYYTDVMIGSLYGLSSKIIRELFPSPMKTVYDSKGWSHPAWTESVVREVVQDPRIQG
jgi:hypothetical protein